MNYRPVNTGGSPLAATPASFGVIILCAVVFLTGFQPPGFALWPLESGVFAVFQLLTYGFLHGNFNHLFFNMFAVWMFGTQLEHAWGSKRWLIYYLVCVLGAGLVQLLTSSVSGQYYPTVGASGGVFGLLLAFGMTFPREVLILIFPPIPIQARWFVLIYAGIELWAGVTGTASGIAHFAHLGGMLFGAVLLLLWRRKKGRGY